MGRSAVSIVVIALLLVVSGCAGLGDEGEVTSPSTEQPSTTTTHPPSERTATQSGTDTRTPRTTPSVSERVRTDGYDFKTNVTLVYSRIESMTNHSGGRVYVGVERRDGYPTISATGFRKAIGFTFGTPVFRPSVAGSVDSRGTVTITIYDEPSQPSVEQTLAHEFVHTVQAAGWSLSELPRSVTEGTAVYVTDEYTKRYLPNQSVTLPQYRRAFYDDSAGPAQRFFYGKYYFGTKYVESRIDDPSEIDVVLDDPPATDEQLLHPETRGNDPPTNLTVRLNSTQNGLHLEEKRRKGELFVRSLLLERTSRSRARTASTGWGNDRVVLFHNQSAGGYVWVTHWDTSQDAREFRRALTAYLRGDSFGNGSRAYNLGQLGNRTVVLRLGPERLVGNVSVALSTARGNRTAVVVRSGD
jgi:hypothetical protein